MNWSPPTHPPIDSLPTSSWFQNKQGGPPLHPYVPRSASGRPLGKAGGRGCVKHSKTKGKKGKKGKKDQYDLIINIDLVSAIDKWHSFSNVQILYYVHTGTFDSSVDSATSSFKDV